MCSRKNIKRGRNRSLGKKRIINTAAMKNDAVKEAFETITLKIESENDREKHSDRIYLRFLPEG